MRNTEHFLRIKKSHPTIYEKHLAPFENEGKLPTDMINTQRLLRIKDNYPPI
jgi:hypothetical protein